MKDHSKNPIELMPLALAEELPKIQGEGKVSDHAIIKCHLYGIAGDWYISEIATDQETAFGFTVVNTEPAWEMQEWFNDCTAWGTIRIKELQRLVNNKFLLEKDIRFLISRDMYWEPKKFSSINTKKNSLYYPGISDRYPE